MRAQPPHVPVMGPSGEPIIGGGVVAFLHNGNRNVSIFSAKNGKLLYTRSGRKQVQCYINPDGLLVLMVDGELTVRNPKDIDKPLYQHKWNVNRAPVILAVSKRYVAVLPDVSKGTFEVVSITHPKEKPIRLDCGKVIPSDAAFDGKNLFVICSLKTVVKRPSQRGRGRRSFGLVVCKFDLHSGKKVWREDIDVDPSKINRYLLGSIIVAQEHIVFSARCVKPIPSVAYYILGAESGKMVQKIEAIDKSQKRTKEITKRLRLIGRVVMTNGRLCLETAEGITVYGGK